MQPRGWRGRYWGHVLQFLLHQMNELDWSCCDRKYDKYCDGIPYCMSCGFPR